MNSNDRRQLKRDKIAIIRAKAADKDALNLQKIRERRGDIKMTREDMEERIAELQVAAEGRSFLANISP